MQLNIVNYFDINEDDKQCYPDNFFIFSEVNTVIFYSTGNSQRLLAKKSFFNFTLCLFYNQIVYKKYNMMDLL